MRSCSPIPRSTSSTIRCRTPSTFSSPWPRRAGKHVLCEKPIGLHAADAERLREAPRDRIIAEAFMVRYHPQWLRAREIVRSGELGELRAIRAAFCYYNVDPANVRNIAEIGGVE